ncbi:hypothetical protein SAMN02744133_10897 [Thalassospira xiamenensis M-5 = DSM 17429]|uniref:Polymer-forming cytoskeletal protein n=1 Tax=Thalassospira xiamenensis M-5 = DSM 17429 TaxID=1123366 RepID=A0AB72UJB8_9PROT|nr:hypothetical protein [Thalassospira xiamenensis]AJD54371.1 hypothetical protein TH3_21493 [Thalassospira xiamenensis M-5 = DSM 17429]SIT21657.1 hypothetical protein SAMN02744133_10897 [Thalassospira xiamenensis M-5 = DSM 17429]
MGISELRTDYTMPADYEDLLLYLIGRDGPARPTNVQGLLDLRPEMLESSKSWSSLGPDERFLKIPDQFGLDGSLHAVGSPIVEIGKNVRIVGDCLLDKSKIQLIGEGLICSGTLRLKFCKGLSDGSFPDHVTAHKTVLRGTSVTSKIVGKFSGQLEIDGPETLTGFEPRGGLLRPFSYVDRTLGIAANASSLRSNFKMLTSLPLRKIVAMPRGTSLSFAEVQRVKGMSDIEVARSARSRAILSAIFYVTSLYCVTMALLHFLVGAEPYRGLLFVPFLFVSSCLAQKHAHASYQLWTRKFVPFRDFIRKPSRLVPHFSAPKGHE